MRYMGMNSVPTTASRRMHLRVRFERRELEGRGISRSGRGETSALLMKIYVTLTGP